MSFDVINGSPEEAVVHLFTKERWEAVSAYICPSIQQVPERLKATRSPSQP